MSKKLNWLWIIIILIILGLVYFFFFYQPEQWTGEEIPVSPVEEEQSAEETDETADWKTYANDKYKYSFKYPSEYNFGPCTTKPCGPFVNEEEGGDYVLLQGDISEKGWPNIEVAHYDTEFYNPPAGISLIEWLKEKSPYKESIPNDVNFLIDETAAIKVHISASPQAYSSDEIYFIKDSKLFQITMLDMDSQEAQDFYNLFLSTFKFTD